MVTIVTTYRNNKIIFKHYWCPLIHKHGEVEFLIVDHDSRLEPLRSLLPNKPNVRIAEVKDIEISDESLKAKGVLSARHETVLVTNINSIPTYQTMIFLNSLTANDMLCPSWQDKFPKNQPTNSSYSVNKQKFTNAQNKQAYIQMYDPKILDHTTMYWIK